LRSEERERKERGARSGSLSLSLSLSLSVCLSLCLSVPFPSISSPLPNPNITPTTTKNTQKTKTGSDPSSEGVQRDLLPLLEGSGVVQTRLGPLSTQHVLFIAAGAFHHCSVSDMMPELQGRLPVRVQLKPLDADDFLRILTEPRYSAVQQQRLLLAAEGVSLRVTAAALRAIAVAAERANARTDDIGARRLHAVLERLLEEASFKAPELVAAAAAQGGGGGSDSGGGKEKGSGEEQKSGGIEYVVDADMVEAAMAEVFKEEDVAKYIL
jgi:ATP-dependent HslUV protease ATP-binding subunit HslU